MSLEKNQNLANKICKVAIALCSNVDSINQGASGEFYRSVVFSSGTWEDIPFTPGTANYDEPAKDTANGILYNQALQIFFPGSDPENLEFLNSYTGKPIIIKITYSNGNEKIIGDKNNPAKLLPSYSVGGKTGRNFDFRRQSNSPAFNLE